MRPVERFTGGEVLTPAQAEILVGVPEDEAPHPEALEARGALIARAERG